MPAQFTKHFVQDLQQDIKIRQCGTIVFNADNLSNVITVDLYNGTEPYSGGGTVAGAVICPDGATVALDNGTLTGNVASVTLKADCFAIPGQIGVGVQVISGSVRTTVLKAIYNVELLSTDNMVDPDSRITASVGQLVADIEAATAEIPASDMASLMSGIAPTFSASTAYPAGAYVYYNGTLYKFTSAHAAGSWTGTDVAQITLCYDITELYSSLYNDTNYSSEIETGQVYVSSVSHGKYILTKTQDENMACIMFDAKAGEQIIYSGKTTVSNKKPLLLIRPDDTLLFGLSHNTNYNYEIVDVSEDCTVYANFITSEITPLIIKRLVLTNSLSATQEAEVQTIIDSQPQDETLVDLNRGFMRGSEFGVWANGLYNSSLVRKDSTAYAYIPPFVPSGEMVFITDNGYFLQGGYKIGDVAYYSTRVCSMHVPNNATEVRISISPMPYGGEGITITPEEADSVLKIINTVITSEYNRYKDTFFGFEMYNKVAFVGDSYTMQRATYNKAWGQIIGQKTGIDVTLFGHSGYSTDSFRTESGQTDSLQGLLSSPANDLYWLGFGINDSSEAKRNPSYIGSVTELDGDYSNYSHTFIGNYGNIIESIRATFPNAKIVLCNCIYHSIYIAQVGSPTVDIPAVNAALVEISQHYNIPLISLFDDVFYLSPEYDNNMQATALTHPDPIIFPGMANANMRLFAKCVADHPDYFKTSTAEG